jgi:hypothetical protein
VRTFSTSDERCLIGADEMRVTLEALRTLRRASAQSLILVAVYAALVAFTLLSVGSARSEVDHLRAQLGGVDYGYVEIQSATGFADLPTVLAEELTRFGSVVEVLGLSTPIDCRSLATVGGSPVSLRTLVPFGPDPVRSDFSDIARAGLKVLRQAQLADTQGIVHCTDNTYRRARLDTSSQPWFPASISNGLYVFARSEETSRFATISVVARGFRDLDGIVKLATNALAERSAGSVQITNSAESLKSRLALLSATLSQRRQALIVSLLTLTAGVSLVRLLTIAFRSSDMGRRRALGCSRRTLAYIVVVEGVQIAAVGVCLGVAIGRALALLRGVNQATGLFTIQLGVIVLTISAFSSLPGVLRAVMADPVAVLRTP